MRECRFRFNLQPLAKTTVWAATTEAAALGAPKEVGEDSKRSYLGKFKPLKVNLASSMSWQWI